ncbi:MAG: DUF3303 family protein [Terriglobales bacterium]
MVIERFKQGNPKPVGERFKSHGRMLPDGVTYQSSWMEENGSRCFQMMDAPNVEAFSDWIRRWDDLVEFETVPVVASADFWARLGD